MGRAVDRRYVVALLVVYVAGLVVLVTRPWGWELNRLTVRLWAFFRYDVPLAPGRFGPEHYGMLLNVLLFVPFGALLVLATRGRWWWSAVIAGFACSSAIELVQSRWLQRDGDWVDVVTNTVGTLIGAAAVSWWSRGRA